MDWPLAALGITVILCFTWVWMRRMEDAQRQSAYAFVQAMKATQKPSVPPMPPRITSGDCGPAAGVYGSGCDCAGCRTVREVKAAEVAAELGEDA